MESYTTKLALLNKIFDRLVQNFPEQLPQHLNYFVQQFYDAQPFENLIKVSIDYHSDKICDLWRFYQQRRFGTPKFNIYWSAETADHSSNRIIIDLINDDMSFLVNSLTALLARYELV